jgi:hypothetical protein
MKQMKRLPGAQTTQIPKMNAVAYRYICGNPLSLRYLRAWTVNLFVLLLCLPEAAGQEARKPQAKVFDDYMAAAGDYALIYNGKEEPSRRLAAGARSHPYFSSPEFQEGKLFYNHIWYESVALRYDMLRDELTVRSPQRAFLLALDRETTPEAWISGAHIVAWTPERWRGVPPCNYLFLIHDGRYPVVKKNKIAQIVKITPEGVDESYPANERFYIRVDSVCYPLTGKKSALKLFPEDRRALNAFVKTRALKFDKQQRESSFLALISYIETLRK